MSALAPDALVFCTGTIRGVDFRTKAHAAAAAGFDAISIRPGEVDELVAAGIPLGAIRGHLADLGLGIAELDPLWLPVGAPPAHAHPTEAVLEMAQALGPDCISVLVPLDAQLDLAHATEVFAALCDHPLAAGQRLAIEFFSWSPLHSLADTWTIVRDAGRDNGGIILDVWHHARRGGTVADLALVDAGRVWGVQIADAPAVPALDDIAADCMRNRRWPGRGALPLDDLVGALRAGGCHAPLGIEVFGSAADSADAESRARLALATLREVADPRRTAA